MAQTEGAMRKHVLVLGSNFGGLTAALAVKQGLHGDVDVTVVSPSDHFLFNPSLVWLPFGGRTSEDITFKVEPTFTAHGINFINEPALSIDPEAKKVVTPSGDIFFDYLIIATGYKNKFDIVPGLGPDGNAYTITTLEDAIKAGEGWKKFLKDPGDIVIAASQGAGCFGAAYEFLFNTSYQLRKAGIKKQVKLSYVTSEPFLGHFGVGGLPHGEALLGMFLKKEKIAAYTNTALEYVDKGNIRTTEGKDHSFKYAIVIPPFLGQDVAKNSGLADDKGYIKVRPTYQTDKYDDIYAVGIAAAVASPWTTAVPVGIPKTGFPTEVMAHTAAKNIASQIKGEPATHEKEFGDIAAICVMDAGNNGVIILADKMLSPRKRGVLIPGPQAHLMKLGFEKYFMWKSRKGYVRLP
jgi:NADH dehydrogenase FAD-containing subunit